MFKILDEKFWAGSFASYWVVMEASEKLADFKPQVGSMKEFIDEVAGKVMTVEGNVAVINVKGSLINGSAGYMRLWGVLGYDEIREALTDAVADKNVKSILLNVDSGGGQVAGCQELGNYIMEVSKIKPVHGHADNFMCSAAYWLGCSADKVSAGNTATVGSIGVLIVHQEMSKMLAENGVTTTVVRSGKYKALANRFEPLSDLAKEELQSQVDQIDEIFTAHVASRRGVTADVAKRKMGQGREFLGDRALDAGLVDSIETLSEAHGRAERSANKSKMAVKPGATAEILPDTVISVSLGSEMKINLTTEQLAALQAGATVESLQLPEADAAALKAELAANAAAAQAVTEEQPEPQPKADSFYRDELLKATKDLATAQVQLEAAEAKVASLEAGNKSLLAIARGSLGNMQLVMLGSNSANAVSDDKVVEEHEKLAAAFGEKFKAGRVSAAKTEDDKPEAKTVPPLFNAAIAGAKHKF